MSKPKNNDSAPKEPVETPAPVATPAPTEAPVATSAPVETPATPEPTSAPVATAGQVVVEVEVDLTDPQYRSQAVEAIRTACAPIIEALEAIVQIGTSGNETQRPSAAIAAEALGISLPPVIETPEPEPVPPGPTAPPWRTVAVARRECTIAYRDGNAHYLGGEWETTPGRVEQLAGCEEYFRFIPVESQEHLDYLQHRFARVTESLREAAREHGYVMVRDGEPLPQR